MKTLSESMKELELSDKKVSEAKKIEEKKVAEAVDAKKIIKELIDTSFGGSNEEQMKAVQLLKGLATSDDAASNAFMKKLDTFTSGMKMDEDFNEDTEIVEKVSLSPADKTTLIKSVGAASAPVAKKIVSLSQATPQLLFKGDFAKAMDNVEKLHKTVDDLKAGVDSAKAKWDKTLAKIEKDN